MALRNPLVIVSGATAEMPAGDAIPATKGGTGASSFTVGDIFYADTTTTLAKLAVSANTYQTLRSNGAGAAPSWAAVYLTSASATQGTLPIIRGGTGANSLTAGMVKSDGTTMSAATAGTDYTTPTGTESLTNKTITEIVYALTGTTPAFTATNGAVQTWTLSAASTPTDSLTTGQSIILVITPGAYSITWPSVTWSKVGGSGAAPTLYSAGKTRVVLWKEGSTLYGVHVGDTA